MLVSLLAISSCCEDYIGRCDRRGHMTKDNHPSLILFVCVFLNMGFSVSLSFSDFVCLVDVDIETLNSVHLILKPQTLACRLS